ncbi:FHA domain-containing protein [Chthonomonas calidirosea]|uniref:FhaA domain-containing protein n=1 Tax=Chthonomonas calidirosea TaxID=454171 RepID=UPI0006DD3E1C|nr:FhaA domain-containing protein [Chthonomonas calidirosea]CEK12541.1 FHA domain-containing protein [Chthonomonas calidirosea]
MDIFEKINRSFAQWYEGLFGGNDDVRPRDILRMILTELEENRKEGFDTRTYVPNQYILELCPEDEEEKEYLLSFLDKAELEEAIRRYCRQNRYHIRGELEFVLKVLTPEEVEERHPPKISIRSRYSARIGTPSVPMTPSAEEDRTVAAVGRSGEESQTVAGMATAYLQIQTPGKSVFRYPLLRSAIYIGRSSRVGNDLVLEEDPMVSKRHLRIEREKDGRFTLYDLGSTNGTWVNGHRVESHLLQPGDDILIGSTHLVFEQETKPGTTGLQKSRAPEPKAVIGQFGGAAATVDAVQTSSATKAQLLLLEGDKVRDSFVLGSETYIGRGITNDIVLPYRNVAIRHARIFLYEGRYRVESQEGAPVKLNDILLQPGEAAVLHSGDRIQLGDVLLSFEIGSEL